MSSDNGALKVAIISVWLYLIFYCGNSQCEIMNMLLKHLAYILGFRWCPEKHLVHNKGPHQERFMLIIARIYLQCNNKDNPRERNGYHPVLFESSHLVMQLGIWVFHTVNRVICSTTFEVDVSQVWEVSNLAVHQLSTTSNQSLQLVCTCIRMHWFLVIFQKCLQGAGVILNFMKSYTSGAWLGVSAYMSHTWSSMARCVCKASMRDGGLFLLVRSGFYFFICVCKELSSATAVSSVLPKMYTVTVELSQRTSLYFLLHHLSHCLQGGTIGLWHKQVLIKSDVSFAH